MAVAEKTLLSVLRGRKAEKTPLWLMRQAGRYLPEYRALRADKGGFLDLVYDPPSAAEVTVQPLRRFQLDGAILFSDILIVPHAIGQNLWFETGEGPRLAPRMGEAQLGDLEPQMERLDAIYETVRLVKPQLSPETTFLGFAGSPWTVATYMIAGQGSREQASARQLAYDDPAKMDMILDRIASVTVDYLSGQIEAGVDAVQLFDSWSGSLAPVQFERFVIARTAWVVSELKRRHPTIPVIGFPKGAGGKLGAYARETGVDAIGLDETVDPTWADRELPDGLPVQGNLDPLALMAGGTPMRDAALHLLDALGGRPHIFNLGHGIGQHTPIAHVEQLVELVRSRKGGETGR
jgi:uroporphyrinogen decarboxylase